MQNKNEEEPLPPRYLVVGAFDRFNYGDVLFAHISMYIIRSRHPGAEIVFYGTHASDLRDQGGVISRSMRDLYRDCTSDADILWIAGGEVLGSRWHLMYEHAGSATSGWLLRGLRRRLGADLMDLVCRRLAGVPNMLPWNFVAESFENAPKIAYNAVGGRSVGTLSSTLSEWQKRSLTEATWVSVRDSFSRDAISQMTGHNPLLVPDSAVIMTDIYEREELDRLNRRTLRRIAGKQCFDKGYVCLQCGINYFSNNDGEIAEQVRVTHERTGLPVIAFAIGRAAGHEDQISAARLSALVKPEEGLHVAPHDLSVTEIMSLISGSRCYVGSSLHGFITAFSFAVPRVGLSPRVRKLIGFRDDWDLSTMPAGIEMTGIYSAVDQAMSHNVDEMERQAETAKHVYLSHLKMVWEALDVQAPIRL